MAVDKDENFLVYITKDQKLHYVKLKEIENKNNI